MRQKIPICKTFTNDSLLKTAIKRSPEYKSYIQSFMIGKCVCISKKSLFSNVQKITSAENLQSRASDEIVPFREFIIKDDTSALL